MILTLYEPFRHWSETGSVYILSDPHFGDLDCKLMDPGWIEPEEQVARINALVMKNDTFVCLGDVGDASFVKQIKAFVHEGQLLRVSVAVEVVESEPSATEPATEESP